jgi:hypothetical protein
MSLCDKCKLGKYHKLFDYIESGIYMANKENIEWLPEKVLRTNVEYSRKMYNILDQDLSMLGEFVAIDERNLKVFSFRLANLILRTGPEILRIFNLILFNKQRREPLFTREPELQKKIADIQEKRNRRKDGFIDYLTAVCLVRADYPRRIGVQIKGLEMFVVPFETEVRRKEEKEFDVVPWWEDGYNALRHRVIEEFSTSATLKHTLFSMAGLWVLHYFLDYDWGREGLARSEFFEQPVINAGDRLQVKQLK